MGFLHHIQNLTKEQAISICTAIAATGLGLYTIYSTTFGPSYDREARKRGLIAVPEAKGALPYVGHLLSLGKAPAVRVTEWANELQSPIIRIHMGVKTWMIICDQQLAHELFVTHGSVTSHRPHQVYSHRFYSLEERGVIIPPPGKRWKKSRAAALTVLAPKHVDRFSEIIINEANYIVEHLIADTKRSGHVEPFKPLQSATMNVVLMVCLGMRLPSAQDPFFKEIIDVVDRGIKYCGADNDMSAFLPILSALDILVRKERTLKHYIETERNPLFRRLIQHGLEVDKDCFVKTLYALKDEYDLDDDGILVMMNDMLAAGSDTIAVTLAWNVAILCHHPDVQAKIHKEIDEFVSVHRRYPTYNEREKFPYIVSVQKECMRYRPTSPFGLLHMAAEDFKCHGYFIPKGTTLVSNMHAMHLNRDVFPDADKFIPERYMWDNRSMSALANTKIETRDQYNFGWGRRMCPGIHLAEVEMFEIYIRLFSRCKIEPALNEKNEPVYPDLSEGRYGGLVLLPEHYHVRFVERSDMPSFHDNCISRKQNSFD